MPLTYSLSRWYYDNHDNLHATKKSTLMNFSNILLINSWDPLTSAGHKHNPLDNVLINTYFPNEKKKMKITSNDISLEIVNMLIIIGADFYIICKDISGVWLG